MIGTAVPWNAMWTGEDRYEVRYCRHAGRPAIWQPSRPGEGRPVFAKPHVVRQRQSIADMRCTVCGERTRVGDRWHWSMLADQREGGLILTTEAPVHRACADRAMTACPRLRGLGVPPAEFPLGFKVLAAMIGGDEVARSFGLRIPPDRAVVGHLKIGWPDR
jgi:hypothetical protein